MTDLHGEQISRLAAHVDPVLAAFTPLWWLWPSPALLLVAQAVAISLGALPVFWLAAKHLRSERAALAFALAYLVYPPVQWLTLDEFHTVALACPLLLFAFWYLDEERPWAAGAFAAVAVLTKEEIGLVVAALGLWYLISHRKAAGIAFAAAGAAWAAFAIAVVVPHYNDGASSAFYGRYEKVGGSPGGLLETAATDPLLLVGTAFDARGLGYLAALALPLLALSLLSPLVLLIAAPELAINLLSSTPTQTSIHFHYTAAEIPWLVAAAVLGSRWLVRRKLLSPVAVGGAVLLACLVANWRLGAVPIWRYVPGGETLQARAAVVSAHDRVLEDAVELIPEGVAVSASNPLGAHLSERRRIFSFPFVEEARWIAVDSRSGFYSDRIDPAAVAAGVARLRQDLGWRIVFERDGVLVFRRVAG